MLRKIYNYILSMDYKKIALALTAIAILLGTDGPPNL
jgi:hypothetical protein